MTVHSHQEIIILALPPCEGYEFKLWQPIYHNDTYSHPVIRTVTVHAHSEQEAENWIKKNVLRSKETHKVPVNPGHDPLTVIAEEEYIKSKKFLGRVKIVQEYKYE